VVTRFTKVRFHVATGPESLFRRIRFKMREPTRLQIHGNHFQERSIKYGAPFELIRNFDPNRWELMMAEVRTDSGKFVSSTWKVSDIENEWWIVIGFRDTIETVYPGDDSKTGLGDQIVKSGLVYDYVNHVNSGLMRQTQD
jgi:hypothetical protein